MRVLYVIHDIRPPFEGYNLKSINGVYTRSMSPCIRFMGSILTLKMWTHQKYCNPRKADIVERYRPLKRIRSSLRAIRVVLIPVDA